MNETFIIANRTDVGRTRDVNEDSMVTFDSPNGRVVAVCDGMGGQAAGDVASGLACDIISDILENNTFATPAEAITRAVMAANQGILHRAAQNPELEGMGATCVIAIIKDGEVTYGWVGDSRIYYYHNGSLRQISRDQSYVQSLVDSGQLTPAEAEHHPRKNEIINALGLDGMTPPEISAVPLNPEPGSILLLCSDGLTGMVSDAQIRDILQLPELTLHEKADRLVARANANGGLDNITLQLVEFPGKAAGVKPVTERSKTLLWACGGVILVLVVALFIMLAGGDSKKETKSQVQGTVDTRMPSTNRQPVRHTSPAPVRVEQTTVKVTEKSERNTGKKNKESIENVLGKKKPNKEKESSEINNQETIDKLQNRPGEVSQEDLRLK